MTKIDEKYKKGKIYKLTSSLTTDVYIGSTIRTLNERLSCHKADYKIFIEKKKNDCTSFRLFEKGIDNVRIELIEELSCNSKYDVHKRERYYIETIDNCINKFIPTRTDREYYQTNSQAISERKKVKIPCECGSVINKGDLSKHKKTKKHTDYMATQITNNLTQLTI